MGIKTLHAIFSDNFRDARKHAKMTQEQLAEKSGVSTNHIGLIEAGRRFPSIDTLERLCQALNVEAFELFIDDASVATRVEDAFKRVWIRQLKEKIDQLITDSGR